LNNIEFKIGTNGQTNLKIGHMTYKVYWNIKIKVKEFIKKNPERIYISTELAKHFNCCYSGVSYALCQLWEEDFLQRFRSGHGYIYIKSGSVIGDELRQLTIQLYNIQQYKKDFMEKKMFKGE